MNNQNNRLALPINGSLAPQRDESKTAATPSETGNESVRLAATTNASPTPVATGNATAHESASSPPLNDTEPPLDGTAPSPVSPTVPSLVGGGLAASPDRQEIDPKDISPLGSPNTMRVMAEVARGKEGRAAAISEYHKNQADSEQAAVRGQTEGKLTAAGKLLISLEYAVKHTKRALELTPRKLDSEVVQRKWKHYDLAFFSGLCLLSVALLGLDFVNMSNIIQSAGLEQFAHDKFAAMCASVAAVLFTLVLKVAAAALIPNRTLRAASLLIPAVVFLGAWCALMARAFPGIGADPAAALNALTSLSGNISGGSGLPQQIAWLLNAVSAFGLSFGAAGLASYAKTIYDEYNQSLQADNPEYVQAAKEYAQAVAEYNAQHAWVGRLQGEMKALDAQKAKLVDDAVAQYYALLSSLPPARVTNRIVPGRWFAA